MPPLNIWIRNGLIGAVLTSHRAVFELIAKPTDHSVQRIAATLAAAGGLAGISFTALTPLSKASRFGHYAVWVIAIYIILAAITIPLALGGDQVAVNVLTMPVGWLFLLGTGFVTGVFCARVADRWSKGDYR
jgi:hypothetical protein